MEADETKDGRLAALLGHLRATGYSVVFREGAWVECFLRRGDERWIGRAERRPAALDDALRRMLPSYLVASRLEALLAPAESAAACVATTLIPPSGVRQRGRPQAGEPREVIAHVAALLTAIDQAVPRLARAAPEWQRLLMLGWMCEARAAEEAFPAIEGVVGGVRRVARALAELARMFWPGPIPALQISVTPDRAFDRRALRSSVPRTWAEAALATRSLHQQKREQDLTAGRDEDGWADTSRLGDPPTDGDAAVRTVLDALDALLGPVSLARDEEVRLLDESRVASLAQCARTLRWLRCAGPALAWGVAMGRLRWAVQALGERGRSLREALDPDAQPQQTWRRMVEGARSGPAADARAAASSAIVASLGRPSGAVEAVERALDVLSTPEIAALLPSDSMMKAALATAAESHADRRVRRRMRDILGHFATPPETNGGVRSIVTVAVRHASGCDVDPTGEATFLSEVRAVTMGRRALFVSNRDDDALAASLAEGLGLSITWCDGSLRRLQAQCSRIGQGSYDLVLGATGFQSHATDTALSRAAAAARVPYVRVNRGRLLAVAQAIARAFGMLPPGESPSRAAAR